MLEEADQIGQLIAERYRVEGVLGTGGMGQVLRARDTQTNRAVAVKILTESAIDASHGRARLLREGRALLGLSHPGIAEVYDVGETDDGGAFVVMELIEGATLRRLMSSPSFNFAQRLRVIVDVARTLGFAHRKGVLHRDIKPDNIMVRPTGAGVLLDFGLVKRVGFDGRSEDEKKRSFVTSAGNILGTPVFMSPEQIRSEPLDGRADQWSLGVTAYEVFTDQLPWKGDSFAAILADALMGQAVDPSEINEALPGYIDTVIARSLSKDPSRRFVDCDAFADALLAGDGLAVGSAETLAEGPIVQEPLATIQSQLGVKLEASASSHCETAASPSVANKSASRWASRAALIVGLIVISLAGWLWQRARARPPEPTHFRRPLSATSGVLTIRTVACVSLRSHPSWRCVASNLACHATLQVVESTQLRKSL